MRVCESPLGLLAYHLPHGGCHPVRGLRRAWTRLGGLSSAEGQPRQPDRVVREEQVLHGPLLTFAPVWSPAHRGRGRGLSAPLL